MPKKKPEPITITGPAGQVYTITVTERGGLRIEIDDRHRIVYTSVMMGAWYVAFEVEAMRGKREK